MRRALVMIGLMTVVFLVTWGGPRAASATQTCTATCSGGSTLSCTVATGTCSSASGTVTCCGQTHDCAAIDAYNACKSDCSTEYNLCKSRCTVRDPCLSDCTDGFHLCLSDCGARPTTSWSC
jgi:hypothetical protein